MRNYSNKMLEYYLEECEKSEYERLSECDETYMINNLIFDVYTDSLICFPIYYNEINIKDRYFKVLKRKKE